MKIIFSSYDSAEADLAVSKTVDALNKAKADFIGPFPLPVKKTRFSKESSKMPLYRRILHVNWEGKDFLILQDVNLPSGVSVEIII